MKTLTVWIVSELYYPEETSTGHFLTGIAEGLASTYRTRVICCRPTYAARAVRVDWRENHNGVDIVRCRATRCNPHRLSTRLLNSVTTTVSMAFKAARLIRAADVVIVVTNPPAIPVVIQAICRLRGARCVLLVHDVYPDVLVAAGVLTIRNVVFRLLTAISCWVYRSVEHVVVLGRDMYRIAEEKGARRITIIPNWGDTDDVVAEERKADNTFRTQLDFQDKFVVQYAGNIGRTHDMATIVEAACELSVDQSIQFMIVGTGAQRVAVEELARARKATNVTFVGRVARNEIGALLNTADIAIVSLVAGMAGVSVPSRIYNILAAALPVIAVAERDSEIARIVAENDIGWVVAPGDIGGLVTAVRQARGERQRLAEMGRRARVVVEQKYTRAAAVRAYADVVKELAQI